MREIGEKDCPLGMERKFGEINHLIRANMWMDKSKDKVFVSGMMDLIIKGNG